MRGPDCAINAYGPAECSVCATMQVVSSKGEGEDQGPIPIGYPLPHTRVFVVDRELRGTAARYPGRDLRRRDRVANGYVGNRIGGVLRTSGVRSRLPHRRPGANKADGASRCSSAGPTTGEDRGTARRARGSAAGATGPSRGGGGQGNRSAGSRPASAYWSLFSWVVASRRGCATSWRRACRRRRCHVSLYPCGVSASTLWEGRPGSATRVIRSQRRRPPSRLPLRRQVKRCYWDGRAGPCRRLAGHARRHAGRAGHFFDLGGDSLRAIRVVARLRSDGYRLAVRQMFAHPRLRDQAACMAREATAPVEALPHRAVCVGAGASLVCRACAGCPAQSLQPGNLAGGYRAIGWLLEKAVRILVVQHGALRLAWSPEGQRYVPLIPAARWSTNSTCRGLGKPSF